MNLQDKFSIILIERSDNLRAVLKDFLEMYNYEVRDFEDGLHALKTLSKTAFDLCLLDMNAEPVNGLYLIHEIKKVDSRMPVVFISSKSDKETRIQGFKEGCDDFVIKPFSIEELELRISAILRRTASERPQKGHIAEDVIFYFADFKFNYTTLELIHTSKTQQLTKKEAEMLRIFCGNINTLIPRQKLVTEVWGEDKAQLSRSMDVYITRLRKYLQVEDTKHDHHKTHKTPVVEIINVHGTGYIFKINE